MEHELAGIRLAGMRSPDRDFEEGGVVVSIKVYGCHSGIMQNINEISQHHISHITAKKEILTYKFQSRKVTAL